MTQQIRLCIIYLWFSSWCTRVSEELYHTSIFIYLFLIRKKLKMQRRVDHTDGCWHWKYSCHRTRATTSVTLWWLMVRVFLVLMYVQGGQCVDSVTVWRLPIQLSESGVAGVEWSVGNRMVRLETRGQSTVQSSYFKTFPYRLTFTPHHHHTHHFLHKILSQVKVLHVYVYPTTNIYVHCQHSFVIYFLNTKYLFCCNILSVGV